MNIENRSLKSGLVLAAVTALAAAVVHPVRSAESKPPLASTDARKAIDPKRLSFYQVPLVCPAAPQIGCGGAAKPLLLDLESNPVVSQAWLNRAGTILAVVWSEKSTAHQHSGIVKTVLKESQPTAKELKGASRKQAQIDFESSSDWYRGADVDRLSEEEAGVIAGRWVVRIRTQIAVTENKAEALQEGFTSALKRKLTGGATRDATREAILKVCHKHLDERDVAVLLDVFKAELQSSTSEK